MKKIRLKTIFTAGFILIMSILIIPQIEFKTRDHIYTYPDLSLDLLDIESSLFKPKQSVGIFSSSIILAEYNLSAEEDKDAVWNKIFTEVNKRKELSNLYDVSIKEIKNNNTFTLEFTFPSYYDNPVKYTQWLTNEGDVNFVLTDSTGQTRSSNVSVFDVEGNVSRGYDNNFKDHLKFSFKDSKEFDLLTAFNATQSGDAFVMKIDNSEDFILTLRSNTQAGIVKVLDVKAIPVNSFDSQKQRSDFLNISRAYFSSEGPLKYKPIFIDVKKIEPPEFAPEGASLIGIMFAVSLTAFFSFLVSRFKFYGAVLGLTMVLSYILFGLFTLKLSSANLSIGTVLGFIFALILGMVLVFEILSLWAKNLNYKEFLNKLVVFSMSFILILFVSTKFTFFTYVLVDIIGTIVAFLVSLALMSLVNFKTILEIYKNE